VRGKLWSEWNICLKASKWIGPGLRPVPVLGFIGSGRQEVNLWWPDSAKLTNCC
jgi:hypothetical protein